MECVLGNITILDGEFTGSEITSKKYEDKWKEITNQINALGLGGPREWRKVRKQWQDLKSKALAKNLFNNNLTGNSKKLEKTLTKWESLITKYLAHNDSALIEGVPGSMESGLTMLLPLMQEQEEEVEKALMTQDEDETMVEFHLDQSAELFASEEDESLATQNFIEQEQNFGEQEQNLCEQEQNLYIPSTAPVVPNIPSSQDTAEPALQGSINMPPTQDTESSQHSPNVFQCSVGRKKEQLDDIHRHYFISGHRLHLKKMELLPYQLANQKMELELKKMQKAKLWQDITQM